MVVTAKYRRECDDRRLEGVTGTENIRWNDSDNESGKDLGRTNEIIFVSVTNARRCWRRRRQINIPGKK